MVKPSTMSAVLLITSLAVAYPALAFDPRTDAPGRDLQCSDGMTDRGVKVVHCWDLGEVGEQRNLLLDEPSRHDRHRSVVFLPTPSQPDVIIQLR